MMKYKNQPWNDPELSPLQKIVRYHNLSLRQFAFRFHIARGTAGRILAGQLPPLDVAIRIARRFKCSVEDIWGKQVPVEQDLIDMPGDKLADK